MGKIKSWLTAIILILLIQNVYCQESNYIVTDSALTSGVTLIVGTDRENAHFIRLKSTDGEIKYFPEQLIEYGFKNGTVYQSKEISISGQTKRVFLERLEHGKITLYYYTERGIHKYFLEKDSVTFIELSKDNFRTGISKVMSDYDWKGKQIRLVRFNKMSLSKLISMYNNGYNKPLPYLRGGVIGGYSTTSLTLLSEMPIERLNGISLIPSSSLFLGVFAELPIGMSDFSFNIGVNFVKSGLTVNSSTTQSDIDVVVNLTSANIPFLLRYTLPTFTWRPFINAGGIYSYHLHNESEIYESSVDQNIITIKEVLQEPLIPESLLGYAFGVGLQYNLDYRKIASAEVRFNQLSESENTLQKRHFEVLLSFSF